MIITISEGRFQSRRSLLFVTNVTTGWGIHEFSEWAGDRCTGAYGEDEGLIKTRALTVERLYT
jgi:hypothetical protein